MARRFLTLLLSLVVVAVSLGVFALRTRHEASAPAAKPIVSSRVSGAVTPIPQRIELDARKVELGRKLFHDARLSRDDSVSCASCHDLARAGQDGRPVAVGIDGQLGDLNSPTVLNSGFNFRQFWDGRAATLEEQAEGPVHNAKEMASNWKQAIAKLSQDDKLLAEFRAIWPDAIQPAQIQAAIAEFERSLITPDSPFDQFLRGDRNALSYQAQEGWRLFHSLGCVACHQGVNLGGNMYSNLGIMGDFFADRHRPLRKADMGRFNLTQREEDRHTFKVPSLRNVALTAPYFHDGSVATLGEAVDLMVRYQLGVTLEPGEREALVAFLAALSGRQPVVAR